MSLLRELSKVLYKTKCSSFFSIKKYGFRLRFFPTKISRRLWVDSFEKRGVYELVDKFYFDYLKPGFVVIDVGANVGYYTLLSCQLVGAGGSVFSIEAHPRVYAYLEKNIALNKHQNIATFNMALGDKKGEIKFSDEARDDLNSVSEEGSIIVPMSRLDDLPIPKNKIDLLKIDVEGYEKFVLEGARATLERTETIFFECWKKHFDKYEYSLGDIFNILDGYGFTFYINDKSGYKEISKYFYPSDCVDIVATKRPEIFSSL